MALIFIYISHVCIDAALPSFLHAPKILVHPNRVAKSGKFDCCVRSLQSLLAYKPEHQKEALFEIALFAEMFHERILRDQGFKIYQSLSSMSDEKVGS